MLEVERRCWLSFGLGWVAAIVGEVAWVEARVIALLNPVTEFVSAVVAVAVELVRGCLEG